jgi:hypothetical protein
LKLVQKHWTLPAAIAVLLAACGGGGGGSSSTGGTPPPVTGTTRTTFVTGAISGFGSVIVNGVHYESDSAKVTMEGKPGTVGALQVGDVVHLEAEIDAQGKAHAKTIDQERLAQGVVQAVDPVAGTLTIDGLVIHVDAATMFDDSIPGGSLAGVAVADRIEAHGFASATGDALATRIEKADAADNEHELTGALTALDTVNKRFTIGTLVVDYAAATLQDLPATGLVEGDIVEVKGTVILADGALEATEVHKEDGGIDGKSGDGGEIEGLVTRFGSATDFDVAGQPVTTNASTSFAGGTFADLALDVQVEVEGTLDAAGKLVASMVAFQRDSTVELAGLVAAVDAAGGTFQALGTTFVVSDATRREDNVTGGKFFALSDLHAGDWVDVSGYPDPVGSGKVIATRLEKDEPRDQVEMRGPADQLVAPTFKIVGTDIETNGSTTFESNGSDMSAADFFTAAAGQTVDVEGTWNGSSVVADKAEIEHED